VINKKQGEKSYDEDTGAYPQIESQNHCPLEYVIRFAGTEMLSTVL